MRAYFFSNMYLSSLQNGLQTAHVVAEMFVKYTGAVDIYLQNWARNHKTIIILNGGYSSNLLQLCDLFSDPQNPYPWANFNEEQSALNGAATCVGIILPEKIYEFDYKEHTNSYNTTMLDYDPLLEQWYSFTSWEQNLIVELQKYSLAR